MKGTFISKQNNTQSNIRVSGNFISIYDTINSYGLLEEASLIWKEIQEQDPELKGKSIPKQFCSINAAGRKTPHTTPCIHSQDIQHLITAIIEWRRVYKLSGRGDYKIDFSKVLFNKQALLNSEEPKTSNLVKPITPTNIIEFRPANTAAVIKVASGNSQESSVNKQVKLRGEVFKSPLQIQRKLQSILNRTPSNSYVKGEDKEFMLELLCRCSYGQALLRKGLYGIKVEQKAGNNYKNFALDVPNKVQTIRIQNYCNPTVNPLFNLKVLEQLQ